MFTVCKITAHLAASLNELVAGVPGFNAVMMDMRCDWKFRVESLGCKRWSAARFCHSNQSLHVLETATQLRFI